MDGSTFRLEEEEADALANGADGYRSVGLEPARQACADRRRHGFALTLAAIAHVGLLAIMMPSRQDTFCYGGVALETVAVSLVEAVPVFSPPQLDAASTDQKSDQAEEPAVAASKANAEPKPQEPKPEAAMEQEPPRQALALDLPPEPVMPDAIALPARDPEAERVPEPVVREEPPPPERKEKPKELVVAAPPQVPEASPPVPQTSAAEAAPGVARAYDSAVSKVLDRSKPRSRGLRGQVRVQFVVDPGGRSELPLVVASSGNTKLDDMVVEAVRRIEFPRPPPELSPKQRTYAVSFAFR